jgi:hypothetical protein
MWFPTEQKVFAAFDELSVHYDELDKRLAVYEEEHKAFGKPSIQAATLVAIWKKLETSTGWHEDHTQRPVSLLHLGRLLLVMQLRKWHRRDSTSHNCNRLSINSTLVLQQGVRRSNRNLVRTNAPSP